VGNVHAELRDLAAADQADRAGTAWDDDPDGVAGRDAERARRVVAIVDSAQPGSLDADDLFAAALVLQHAPQPGQQPRAADLALAAAELGHPRAPVLHAAAVDRALMSRAQPQRYGTQSIKDVDGPLKLWPVDPATTDEERARWGVRPLAELLAEVDGRIAELEQLRIRGDDA
jgi:hypothetical protein